MTKFKNKIQILRLYNSLVKYILGCDFINIYFIYLLEQLQISLIRGL